MSEIKLLPCPFCGESELIHRSQMHFTDSTEENMIHEDGTKKWTYIECGRCGCSTKAYCYEYQSTNKWNTRKPMDNIVEQLEEEKEQSYAYFETYVNNTNPSLDSEYDDFFHKGLGRAIDIVRAGGKE